MTGPDSPAVAELREWAFSPRRSGEPRAHAARAALAELDEARRELAGLHVVAARVRGMRAGSAGSAASLRAVVALYAALDAPPPDPTPGGAP